MPSRLVRSRLIPYLVGRSILGSTHALQVNHAWVHSVFLQVGLVSRSGSLRWSSDDDKLWRRKEALEVWQSLKIVGSEGSGKLWRLWEALQVTGSSGGSDEL